MVEAIRATASVTAAAGSPGQRPARPGELPPQQQRKLQQLQAKDLELRLGHLDLTTLTFETGPDGKRYAVAAKPPEPPPKEQAPTADPAQAEDTVDPEEAQSDQPKTRKTRVTARLPAEAFRNLTPAELLRRAQVEAAYLAQAATGPRINITA